jgi:hypothetical protein
VGNFAQALVLIGRHSDDMEDERALGFCAHHAVQRGQFADSISGREHGCAPYARITVCGIRRVQLVHTTDPADFPVAFDRITDREKVIAGNSKTVADTFICEALYDVIGDVGRTRHCCWPFIPGCEVKRPSWRIVGSPRPRRA